MGPDWSFWIPVLGIALFVSPLLGSAVASSFPEIGPRPLTVKEAFAAVTPLKLELDSLPLPSDMQALTPEAAIASELDGGQVVERTLDVREVGEAAAGPTPETQNPLASASPIAAASALTTAFPVLDDREVAEEGADERRVSGLPAAARSTASGWRQAAITDAFSKLGTRYRWGGEQPGGFDCSGFVQYVMRRQGIALPRTAREMRAATRAVGSGEMQPGDLVFFQRPDHVGIYIGDNMFVHASSGRGQVTVSTLRGSFYQKRYIGSGRAAE